MYLVASLALALLFALALTASIKKHAFIWYGIVILIVIFEWFYYTQGLRDSFPDWFTVRIMNLFKRNPFGTALFVLVMYAGVLKSSWGAARKLKSIRKELAILGCYLTLGHNLVYGKKHFVNLFTNPGDMKPQHLIAALISIVMIVIMLILLVTSYQWVRRKMKASTWKQLHRMAYLFFALIYIHTMVLFIPKVHKKWLAIIVYTIVFVGYYVIKFIKRPSARQTGTE